VKIRMITTSASPAGVLRSDRVYEVEDKQAKAWIAAGFAALPGEPAAPAVAVAEPKKRAPRPPRRPAAAPVDEGTAEVGPQ